jgi:hypothetical protein
VCITQSVFVSGLVRPRVCTLHYCVGVYGKSLLQRSTEKPTPIASVLGAVCVAQVYTQV